MLKLAIYCQTLCMRVKSRVSCHRTGKSLSNHNLPVCGGGRLTWRVFCPETMCDFLGRKQNDVSRTQLDTADKQNQSVFSVLNG